MFGQQVSFTPTISGVYALRLLLDGARPLAGTPFPIRVKTDETAAANCRLFGPGLTRACAGQATTFQIQGDGTRCCCGHRHGANHGAHRLTALSAAQPSPQPCLCCRWPAGAFHTGVYVLPPATGLCIMGQLSLRGAHDPRMRAKRLRAGKDFRAWCSCGWQEQRARAGRRQV